MNLLTLARKNIALVLGLFAVLAYWLYVMPPGLSHLGSYEDLCGLDVYRQLMAENFVKYGRPAFETTSVLAPTGASIPFFPWTVELDGFGALAWLINPKIPHIWLYFGLSLVGTYLGVGWILRKMKLPLNAAWALAALAVVNHLPRHQKTYHHSVFLGLHWVYGSIFLDAWIWQRFYRDRKFSWNLEIWRGVFLVGMMWINGYFWGPLVFEWVAARICLLIGLIWSTRKNRALSSEKEKKSIQIEGLSRRSVFPFALVALLSAGCLVWFLPLLKEVQKFGQIYQPTAWHTHLSRILQPLWADPLIWLVQLGFPKVPSLLSFKYPETVVTVGWLYWIPVLFGLSVIRKKKGGPGWGAVLPLLIFLGFAVTYAVNNAAWFISVVHITVPFMKYFRVASRMGLYLPVILVALIALMWPELSRAAPKVKKSLIAVFCMLSLVEMAWILEPIHAMPALDHSTEKLLTQIKNTPGDTVLDLPFCSAGGNGVCSEEQCPHYPYSTTGQCFRGIHEKKVYGLYQPRMTEAHCDLYRKAPYTSWFKAWREERCLQSQEWPEFCDFLDQTPGLSAILVYPGIWKAAAQPECRAEFDRHLGAPLDISEFLLWSENRGKTAQMTPLLRYGTRCVHRN